MIWYNTNKITIHSSHLFYWYSRAFACVQPLKTDTRLYRLFNQLIPHNVEHDLPQLEDKSLNVFLRKSSILIMCRTILGNNALFWIITASGTLLITWALNSYWTFVLSH